MSDSNGQFSTSRTTDTACLLDCPDACSLSVQVEHGRIVKIDGSTEQPVTNGYICAKVRNFGERVYGESRLLVPGIREGTKGRNKFRRASWDEALNLITKKIPLNKLRKIFNYSSHFKNVNLIFNRVFK